MRTTSRAASAALLAVCAFVEMPAVHASTITAIDFNFFTQNGLFSDSPDFSVTLFVSEEAGKAKFEIVNTSSIEATVANVYVEAGGLDSLDSILPGPGTAFVSPGNPGEMPSANTLTPAFQSWASVGASAPPAHNGIDPGESMALVFNLSPGTVLSDIESDLLSGQMRLGLHVIALPDGSSESAVTPEPATLLLLAGGSALIRRRIHR